MLEHEAEALLPTIPKAWIIGAAGLALLAAGLGAWSCVGKVASAAHAQKANQLDTAAAHSASQGDSYVAQVPVQAAQVLTDAAEVARLRAEVARLRKAPVTPPAPPAGPSLPAPEPVVLPSDSPALAHAKDGLIDAQRKQIQDQASEIHTLTLGMQSYKSAFQQAQASLVQERAAHPEHPWAAGGSYGTDRQAGVWVERNLGRIRVGVDVVRHPLAAGNSTLEAVARIGWSF